MHKKISILRSRRRVLHVGVHLIALIVCVLLANGSASNIFIDKTEKSHEVRKIPYETVENFEFVAHTLLALTLGVSEHQFKR